MFTNVVSEVSISDSDKRATISLLTLKMVFLNPNHDLMHFQSEM